MPIYEYRCAKCERSFEAFVRPHDDGAECPRCHHSTKLTRELSTFAARSNGDSAAAASAAIANSGTSSGNGFSGGGGCCGGGCGCH